MYQFLGCDVVGFPRNCIWLSRIRICKIIISFALKIDNTVIIFNHEMIIMMYFIMPAGIIKYYILIKIITLVGTPLVTFCCYQFTETSNIIIIT